MKGLNNTINQHDIIDTKSEYMCFQMQMECSLRDIKCSSINISKWQRTKIIEYVF